MDGDDGVISEIGIGPVNWCFARMAPGTAKPKIPAPRCTVSAPNAVHRGGGFARNARGKPVFGAILDSGIAKN